MNFYERFIDLCNKKNVSPSSVASQIGLSNSATTYWKRGSIPKSDTLQKLAAYFGVSSDYFLANEESTAKESKSDLQIFAQSLDGSIVVKSSPNGNSFIFEIDESACDPALLLKFLEMLKDFYKRPDVHIPNGLSELEKAVEINVDNVASGNKDIDQQNTPDTTNIRGK